MSNKKGYRSLSCTLGNTISYEEARTNDTYKSCSCDDNGFVCSGCGEYSCSSCLKHILELVNDKCKKAAQEDEICQKIVAFLHNNSEVPDKCHCCRFGKRKDLLEMHQKNLNTGSCEMAGDGDLCLHQFGICIETPDSFHKTVDVHGFGAEAAVNLGAAWHEVVGANDATTIHKANIKPIPFPGFGESAGHIHRRRPLEIILPDYLSRSKKTTVSQALGFANCRTRQNSPTF